MSDGQPQGAANFKRRTWDKEFFAQKARERAEHAQQEEQRVVTIKSDKEEFQAADAGAAGPALPLGAPGTGGGPIQYCY